MDYLKGEAARLVRSKTDVTPYSQVKPSARPSTPLYPPAAEYRKPDVHAARPSAPLHPQPTEYRKPSGNAARPSAPLHPPLKEEQKSVPAPVQIESVQAQADQTNQDKTEAAQLEVEETRTRFSLASLLDNPAINFLLCLIAGACAGAIVFFSGVFSGLSGATGYFYLSELCLDTIKQGVLWPLYMLELSGDVLSLSFGMPLSKLVLALFLLPGLSMPATYALFCGVYVCLELLVWQRAIKRTPQAFEGLFALFMAALVLAQIILLFVVGNLAACLCLAVFPLLFAQVYAYASEGNWRRLPLFMLLLLVSLFFDVRICACAAAALALFALIVCAKAHAAERFVISLLSGALTALLAAFWLFSMPSQLTSLVQALDHGNFTYVFDRTLGLGKTSVVINTNELLSSGIDATELAEAARLTSFSEDGIYGSFVKYSYTKAHAPLSVSTTYSGLALGSNASVACELYPALDCAQTSSLDDYTFGDLEGFEVLYLDGFTYSDIDEAQKLLEKLAVSGTHIVINIAANPSATKDFSFSASYAELIEYVSVDLASVDVSQDVDANVEQLGEALQLARTDLPVHSAVASGAQAPVSLVAPSAQLGATLSLVGAAASLILFGALFAWERHLIKVNEITTMAREALEVARVNTTSARVDLEPSSWSVDEWRDEQISEYVGSSGLFKHLESYPTLNELSELSSSMGADAWRQASDAAQVVAHYLRCHPHVMAVRYPGLTSDPLYPEASGKLRGGFGPYVWFATAQESQFVDCTHERDARALILKLEDRLR